MSFTDHWDRNWVGQMVHLEILGYDKDTEIDATLIDYGSDYVLMHGYKGYFYVNPAYILTAHAAFEEAVDG